MGGIVYVFMSGGYWGGGRGMECVWGVRVQCVWGARGAVCYYATHGVSGDCFMYDTVKNRWQVVPVPRCANAVLMVTATVAGVLMYRRWS